jgi:hypothetical protein
MAPSTSSTSTNQPNIVDQFNKNLAIRDAAIKVDPATLQIFKLPAMVGAGVHPKPIPFGRNGQAGQSERGLPPA